MTGDWGFFCFRLNVDEAVSLLQQRTTMCMTSIDNSHLGLRVFMFAICCLPSSEERGCPPMIGNTESSYWGAPCQSTDRIVGFYQADQSLSYPCQSMRMSPNPQGASPWGRLSSVVSSYLDSYGYCRSSFWETIFPLLAFGIEASTDAYDGSGWPCQ